MNAPQPVPAPQSVSASWWRSVRRTLARLCWRPTCVACGGSAESDDLCTACRTVLPVPGPACTCCAQPLAVAAPLCGRCSVRLPRFERAWCAWRYRDPIDGLIQRYKLGGQLAVGRALALAAAERRRLEPDADPPQLLVPVPLHPSRLRERGFDQAAEITRVWSRALGIAWANALQRQRATPTQTGLKRAARRANVRHAFVLAPGQKLEGLPCVALVDDVLTTGATANACALVLRKAGVRRVVVWTLARAGSASAPPPPSG